MKPQPRLAIAQLAYLAADLTIIIEGKWWRWLTCWFGSSAGVVTSYRLDRFFYLLFGSFYSACRPLFFPLFLFFRLLSASHDIHYKANIGKGMRIMHPALGAVVSGRAVIGNGLILTGGNCIGIRERAESHEDFILGHHVTLGANAVIIGPAVIGSHVTIGAGAVVTQSFPDNVVLAGVPAKIIKTLETPPSS